jgi:hypothetical protein
MQPDRKLVGTGVDEPGIACSVNPTGWVPFVRSSSLAWWSTGLGVARPMTLPRRAGLICRGPTHG